MREGMGEAVGRRVLRFFQRGGDVLRRGSREFAQDGVDEGGGRALARALHQFNTLVKGCALRDTIEPAELVEGETQGDQDF